MRGGWWQFEFSEPLPIWTPYTQCIQTSDSSKGSFDVFIHSWHSHRLKTLAVVYAAVFSWLSQASFWVEPRLNRTRVRRLSLSESNRYSIGTWRIRWLDSSFLAEPFLHLFSMSKSENTPLRRLGLAIRIPSYWPAWLTEQTQNGRRDRSSTKSREPLLSKKERQVQHSIVRRRKKTGQEAEIPFLFTFFFVCLKKICWMINYLKLFSFLFLVVVSVNEGAVACLPDSFVSFQKKKITKIKRRKRRRSGK